MFSCGSYQPLSVHPSTIAIIPPARGRVRGESRAFATTAVISRATVPAVNVIGFDDGPFERAHRGDVLPVGAGCSRTHLDGVVTGRVRREGADATRRISAVLEAGPFRAHVRAVMLAGIAVAGLRRRRRHPRAPAGARVARDLGDLVGVPDLDAVRCALFSGAPAQRLRVRGAGREWRLVGSAGAVEPLGVSGRAGSRAGSEQGPTGLRGAVPRLWVQRAGLTLLRGERPQSRPPAPPRQHPRAVAMGRSIAGGVATGSSHGRRSPGRDGAPRAEVRRTLRRADGNRVLAFEK